jgi:uncharacterized membrane protein YtjA (UPF0391 family)
MVFFRWALVLLVIGFVAALFGIGPLAALSFDVAKLFLLIALVVLLVSFFTRQNLGEPEGD